MQDTYKIQVKTFNNPNGEKNTGILPCFDFSWQDVTIPLPRVKVDNRLRELKTLYPAKIYRAI